MSKLTTVIAAVLLTSAAAFGQPKLVAPAQRFDFGLVPTQSILTHSFWLHSTGTDTVRIDEIKTGCSCAVSELESKIIAPGDSIRLGIEWDIRRLRGGINRSPMIFYNGNEAPYRVHLSGQTTDFPDSARPVFAKPYRFELAKAGSRDITEVKFELINRSDEDVNIEVISTLIEEIELEIPEKVGANDRARGVIRIKPDYKDKEFAGSITLLMDDRSEEKITIPVRRVFY